MSTKKTFLRLAGTSFIPEGILSPCGDVEELYPGVLWKEAEGLRTLKDHISLTLPEIEDLVSMYSSPRATPIQSYPLWMTLNNTQQGRMTHIYSLSTQEADAEGQLNSGPASATLRVPCPSNEARRSLYWSSKHVSLHFTGGSFSLEYLDLLLDPSWFHRHLQTLHLGTLKIFPKSHTLLGSHI